VWYRPRLPMRPRPWAWSPGMAPKGKSVGAKAVQERMLAQGVRAGTARSGHVACGVPRLAQVRATGTGSARRPGTARRAGTGRPAWPRHWADGLVQACAGGLAALLAQRWTLVEQRIRALGAVEALAQGPPAQRAGSGLAQGAVGRHNVPWHSTAIGPDVRHGGPGTTDRRYREGVAGVGTAAGTAVPADWWFASRGSAARVGRCGCRHATWNRPATSRPATIAYRCS
jgi:hypothetical protein